MFLRRHHHHHHYHHHYSRIATAIRRPQSVHLLQHRSPSRDVTLRLPLLTPHNPQCRAFHHHHHHHHYQQQHRSDQKQSSLEQDVIDRLVFEVKPHIDFRGMVESLEQHVCNVRERRMDHLVDVERVAVMYRESCALEQHINDLRHLRKVVSAVMMPRVGQQQQQQKKKKKQHQQQVEEKEVNEEMDELAVCRTLQRYLPLQQEQLSTTTTTTTDATTDIVNVTNVSQELKDAALGLIAAAEQDSGSVAVYPTSGQQQQQVVNQQAKQLWINLGKLLKQEISAKEVALVNMKDAVLELGKKVPNLSLPVVPRGEDPVEIRVVGKKPSSDDSGAGVDGAPSFHDIVTDLFGAEQVERSFLRHEEVAELLDLVDFESAALISGSKFFYFKNEAVLLELALTNYALGKAVAKGFTPHTVPELVRRPIIEGCGFQSRGENSQIYNIEGSDLSLIGTSEIALAGLNANKIMNEEKLPVRVAATSHCFRTEAGGGGKEGGLYRVHQFTKVEMFVFCKPEQSEQVFQEVVDTQEEIFTELGFHFKVLEMPAHDLGAPAARKVDIEAYMPARQEYGELSSSSNCTDYQSRRLFTRYKDPITRQNLFVHTINGTAIAVPRVILTILEQFQYRRKDNGRIGVVIPPVLRPFLGGMTHIEQKSSTTQHKDKSEIES